MKKKLVLGFAFFLFASAVSHADQSNNPCAATSERPTTSSNNHHMGIAGNPSGQSCPGIELFWLTPGSAKSALCLERGGNPVMTIASGGMAMFSPDCRWFWVTGGYRDGSVHVFTSAGKDIGRFKGVSPAWSANSQSVFYFTKPNQLSAWTVSTKKSRKVLSVADFVSCRRPNEAAIYAPVKAVTDSEVHWQYPTSRGEKPGAPGSYPAKQISFHPDSGEISNTLEGAMSCGG